MVKKFYNMLVVSIEEEEVLTDVVIDKAIEELRYMPCFKDLEEKDINNVKNKVTANNGIKMDIGSCIVPNYEYKKWFLSKKSELNMKYWDRYREYLLRSKKFPNIVVNTIDTVTDSLVDLLGDPTSECSYSRKGLIIGDVQSGKTSNYTGLICKGADVGYKVIVVLTGTIEKLRKQTQLRIDEGFIGADSNAIIRKKISESIGAGRYSSDKARPIAYTSVSNDFNIANAKALSASIESFAEPLIFVVKKNVSTLKNLNTWLQVFNKDEGEKITNSLLVIDDESDNASVNTKDADKDPTSINKQIRVLLSLFSKSSYVGFTATPFANVFINPETENEMLEEDLFPKDYIYSLNAPSNYIGARDIYLENAKYENMLREIDSEKINTILPLKHKKYDKIVCLPNDLKFAIRLFLIANVIRDLRGDKNSHRSMLVNMSRFNDMQKQIEEEIEGYVKSIQYFIKVNGSRCDEEIENDIVIKELRKTFFEEYSDCEFDWNDIQRNMYEAIASVEIKLINQSSGGDFDYDSYQNGARVIAVGGLSLSRGLTLEGLIISYFYRNSKMYDTLMQMGRWFGYRDGYSDLCRVWMTKESIEWYKYISEATDEFRIDVRRYQDSKYTPKDFGMSIRSSYPGLLVTARNKMRTAEYIERPQNLSSTVIETPYLLNDINIRNENYKVIKEFTKKLNEKCLKPVKASKNANNYIYKGIDSSIIMDLLAKINISKLNQRFDIDLITNFIQKNSEKNLEKWDVIFKSGSSKEKYNLTKDIKVECVNRQGKLNENEGILLLNSNRLGSSADGKIGLCSEQVRLVENNFRKLVGNEAKSTPQKEYFKIERSPNLIIYLLEIIRGDNGNNIYENVDFVPYVGLSIGIPRISGSETVFVRYAINKTHQLVGEGDFDFEDDE